MTDTETKLKDALREIVHMSVKFDARGTHSQRVVDIAKHALLAAHASARAQPASAGPASVGADVYLLARRCLWIAFVWNDHNFDEAHVEARKEAARQGIHSFSDANVWLDSLHVHSLNTAPQPAKEADR